jgi:chromosomal replication initiation ATPase DnaA
VGRRNHHPNSSLQLWSAPCTTWRRCRPRYRQWFAFAQRALADFERLQSADRLTAISYHVALMLGVTYERLLSKSRTQHLAYCRHVAMYVCRSLAGASYTALGIHFQRNHSTAYWAVRLITTRMARDAGFRRAIEQIERELTSTTAPVAAAA